jgi:hypothetical protein
LQDREIAHRGLTKLHLVKSMHERKALMASCRMLLLRCPAATERSTKFFEIVTWAQLNIHFKPCVLINTDGYYDFLLRFLDHAVREEFARAANLMAKPRLRARTFHEYTSLLRRHFRPILGMWLIGTIGLMLKFQIQQALRLAKRAVDGLVQVPARPALGSRP